MVSVSFALFCAVSRHAINRKTLVYWRLLLAAAIMTITYLLQIVYLSHLRSNHYHIKPKSALFKLVVFD
jgi:hypothetical protein